VQTPLAGPLITVTGLPLDITLQVFAAAFPCVLQAAAGLAPAKAVQLGALFTLVPGAACVTEQTLPPAFTTGCPIVEHCCPAVAPLTLQFAPTPEPELAEQTPCPAPLPFVAEQKPAPELPAGAPERVPVLQS
jgi:hypothetical protein